MTGIYNRAGFNDQILKVMEKAESQNASVSMFFIDMNGLKKVNDSLGHEEGDAYIKAMANILVENSPSGSLVCRYGGDEFIVFATGMTEVETQGFKNKIQTAMTDYNEAHSGGWILDSSIGCCFEQSAVDVDLYRMVELADQDMYKNKRKKKASYENETDIVAHIG